MLMVAFYHINYHIFCNIATAIILSLVSGRNGPGLKPRAHGIPLWHMQVFGNIFMRPQRHAFCAAQSPCAENQ